MITKRASSSSFRSLPYGPAGLAQLPERPTFLVDSLADAWRGNPQAALAAPPAARKKGARYEDPNLMHRRRFFGRHRTWPGAISICWAAICHVAFEGLAVFAAPSQRDRPLERESNARGKDLQLCYCRLSRRRRLHRLRQQCP